MAGTFMVLISAFLQEDYKSLILPMDLHHESPGYSMDDSFYEILKKVVSKHKNNYKTIYNYQTGFGRLLFFKLKWMHNTEMFRNNVRNCIENPIH